MEYAGVMNNATKADTMETSLTNLTIHQMDWSPVAMDTANCTSTVTEAELERMIQIVHGIIIPILAGVGIILNGLNLIVLSNGKLTESSYTYLTGLAFSDLSMLIFFLINGIGRGNFPNNSNWRYFEAYVYFPCGFVMSTAGALLTVTVSVERYIFIYKPMRARLWCNRYIARKVMVLLWIICIALNIPRFFVFEVDTDIGKLEYTDFGKSLSYKYLSWFQLLIISCGSGLALIVLNILLIRGIHRNNTRRQALGARSHGHERGDELRLTRTLISIVFIFVMGELPSALTSRALVIGISGDHCTVETKAFKIMSLISTILIVLQLSLNFVVYCVLNRRFWAVFTEQLCPCSSCQGRSADNNNHPCELTSLHDIANSKININTSKQNGLHS